MQHFDSSLLSGAFVPRSRFYNSPFGRLFPNLDPWVPEGINDDERRANLKTFATHEMFEPDNAGDEFDNANMPAGYTYLGQFIDHDITFDPTSSLMRKNDPNRIRNFRTPRFDLDCVYGAGPKVSNYLYSTDRFGFFLIDSGASSKEEDLPRNSAGTALIGDPRNDENVIISQLQLCFLKLHNRVLSRITGGSGATDEQFNEAQRIVRWFYQYIVWHDFVKRIVADSVYNSVLKKEDGLWKLKTHFYKWSQDPYIPVEFSVAAYRFGHSLVRPSYIVNTELGNNSDLPIFAPPPHQPGKDLRGGQKLHEKFTVQWDCLLKYPTSDVHGGFPQLTRKIDTKLSKAVFHIPDGSGGSNPLAALNLWRSWQMELPSGTAVAKAMGLRPISVSGIEDSLMFYILKEAETLPGGNAGKMLGPVGGRIVAEVFAGLLYGDQTSFVRVDPAWTPGAEPALAIEMPVNQTETWEFADLVRAAEMPIDGGQIRNIFS